MKTYARLKIGKETHKRIKIAAASEGLNIIDYIDKITPSEIPQHKIKKINNFWSKII